VSNAPGRTIDASLIVPALIGACWLALAIATLAQLDAMGRTLTEACAAKPRAPAIVASSVATCGSGSVTRSAIRAN
jgi:hypothetical protein